jgi:hypothetical protein
MQNFEHEKQEQVLQVLQVLTYFSSHEKQNFRSVRTSKTQTHDKREQGGKMERIRILCRKRTYIMKTKIKRNEDKTTKKYKKIKLLIYRIGLCIGLCRSAL